MAPPLVSIAPGDVERLAARLEALGKSAPDAVARAVNRARVTVTARLVRWIAAATGIRSTRVRKSIRSRVATRQSLVAAVSLYGRHARLIDYDRRIQSANLPQSGFKQRMPGSGHVGYFERAPGARHRRVGQPFAGHALPIRELYGPAFTSFLGDVGLADLLRYGGERLRIELERELSFRELPTAA